MALTQEDLFERLTSCLPKACEDCLRVVGVFVEYAPSHPRIDDLAKRTGHRTRADLNQALARHGFPTPKNLLDWIRALHWLWVWERTGAALTRQAWSTDQTPSVCQRTIKRSAGYSWSGWRDMGLSLGLEWFRSEVGSRVRCP